MGKMAMEEWVRLTIDTFYEINSLTSDFSSFNSATEESIFARLKSLIGRPCMMFHLPPRTRTGNDEINPFSTPQLPSEQTATLCQSLFGVSLVSESTVSTI